MIILQPKEKTYPYSNESIGERSTSGELHESIYKLESPATVLFFSVFRLGRIAGNCDILMPKGPRAPSHGPDKPTSSPAPDIKNRQPPPPLKKPACFDNESAL